MATIGRECGAENPFLKSISRTFYNRELMCSDGQSLIFSLVVRVTQGLELRGGGRFLETGTHEAKQMDRSPSIFSPDSQGMEIPLSSSS